MKKQPNPGSHSNEACGQQQRCGFGSRVQSALGRLTPRSWGVGHSHHAGASSSSAVSRLRHSDPSTSNGDLELSARQTTSSMGTEAGAAAEGTAAAAASTSSRPQTGSISHVSSAGSLGAATNNDANSVASGSSHLGARHMQQQPGSASTPLGTPASAAADDLCSLATQAGSAAHSFNSLTSMMTTHGDASSDGGTSLIPAAPALSERTAALVATSPTAAGSSNFSFMSTYRSSDAGGDATSVSTLPLISEAGMDERLLEVQEQEQEDEQGAEQERERGGVRDVSSEGGPDAGSDSQQPKGRISSGHGSFASLTSTTSEQAAPGLSPVARMPSPAHTRSLHGQRSSSRHSFQQQLQQQLLQDLEESQEEDGCMGNGLPVPFSTRRRPENDDMCSYATQAGSSVHSLSSVMSHPEPTNQSQQRQQQWSSDGHGLMTAGSSKSFSSFQQQQSSRSRRTSAEATAHASASSSAAAGAAAAAASPAALTGPSAAASPVNTDYGSGTSTPTTARSLAAQGQEQELQQQHGPRRKNSSLRGALRAVSQWGSGISHRLQRSGSNAGQQQQRQHGNRSRVGQQQQQHRRSGAREEWHTGQEMVGLRHSSA